jgi:hypothetical protein
MRTGGSGMSGWWLAIWLGVALTASPCDAQADSTPSAAPWDSATAPVSSTPSPADSVAAGTRATPFASDSKSLRQLEESARRWSVLGTLLPVAGGGAAALAGGQKRGGPGAVVAVTGLVVGPSLGYLRGGCARRGVMGTLTRAGAIGLFTLCGGFVLFSTQMESSDPAGEAIGVGIIGAGGAIAVTSAVYDIARVERHVRNRAAGHRVTFRLEPARTGGGAPALAVRMRF